MIMELVNRQSFRTSGKESFPFPLFGFLWFFSMLIVLSGMVILRNVRNLRREGNKRLAKLVFLLLGAVLLVSTVWACGAWMIDQMPCFLGVPICD
jgi:hypothetical protein